MPVAAVIPAVAAVGAAVAALTAFTILGAVGAVAGAVGTIAGVKPLAIAGGAMTAAGGLGATADHAGLFGSESPTSATGTSLGAAPVTPGEKATYENVGDLIAAKGFGFDNDVLSVVGRTATPPEVLHPSPVAPTDQFGQVIPQGASEGGGLCTVENPAAPHGLVNQAARVDTTYSGNAPTPIKSHVVTESTGPSVKVEADASAGGTGAGDAGACAGSLSAGRFTGRNPVGMWGVRNGNTLRPCG